jgi:hypothetical protein
LAQKTECICREIRIYRAKGAHVGTDVVSNKSLGKGNGNRAELSLWASGPKFVRVFINGGIRTEKMHL